MELGIALLEGGNQDIQKSLYNQLVSGEVSQNFFRVFYDKMTEAQSEIKSTVTVNTSDIAARANEASGISGKDVKDPKKDDDKKPGAKGRECLDIIHHLHSIVIRYCSIFR